MSSSSSHKPRGDSEAPSLVRGGPSCGSFLALIGVHSFRKGTMGVRVIRARIEKTVETNAGALLERMQKSRTLHTGVGGLLRGV